MAKTAKGSGRDNRKIIINTAISIIGEKGVEHTSLARIAKESGLSKGTIYYYYASKNDLIFDIADLHMDRISATLFSMLENEKTLSREQMLTAFFETLLGSETRSRLHLYLIQEAVSGNTVLKERFRKTYARWFSLVEKAYSRMPGSRKEFAAESEFIVALADGLILQTLLETDMPPLDKIVSLVRKIL
ncbi:MAG: TetR/AcrR family transcriptional regulator [Desulfococcaceae bacterium]|jgi:AcrR family transcriptional regulator|nr:TetR/AcrR family transcriptional regulator [Desulfococcaceae bacterium]